jgi:hypothetical protein
MTDRQTGRQAGGRRQAAVSNGQWAVGRQKGIHNRLRTDWLAGRQAGREQAGRRQSAGRKVYIID